MASKTHVLLFLLSFLFAVNVFADDVDPENSRDIKVILGQFPEFSVFAKLLTESGVADEINARGTATVLAVADTAVSPLSALSGDALKHAISNHVLAGYYDPYYLDRLPTKPAKIDTFAQPNGVSFTENPTDQSMAFGAADANAPYNSILLKVVAAKTYNISVLQVSSVIGATGSEASPATPGTPAAAIPLMAGTPAASVSPSIASGPVAQGPSSGANSVVGALSFGMAMAFAAFMAVF